MHHTTPVSREDSMKRKSSTETSVARITPHLSSGLLLSSSALSGLVLPQWSSRLAARNIVKIYHTIEFGPFSGVIIPSRYPYRYDWKTLSSSLMSKDALVLSGWYWCWNRGICEPQIGAVQSPQVPPSNLPSTQRCVGEHLSIISCESKWVKSYHLIAICFVRNI